MRITAIVLGATLASLAFQAEAQDGVPGKDVLAEMGLSSLQVMSDEQASSIRGSGFSWGWGKADPIFNSFSKYRGWIDKHRGNVQDFQQRSKLHRSESSKNAWYRQGVDDYRSKVKGRPSPGHGRKVVQHSKRW